MGAADGARAAVGAELVDLGKRLEDARASAAGEQLELVGLPADLAPERAEKARSAVRARAAGRPIGAENKATADVKDFCRRVFGFDPLIEGFRWAQHTPESLAIALACTKLEAFDRLEGLRRELARYFYAPMAPTDAAGNAVPFFHLQLGAALGPPGAALPPWQADPRRQIEHEQNQGVSETAPAVSHLPHSHDEPK